VSPAARSIFVFGCYLVLLGAGLILVPNLILAPSGFPPTSEADRLPLGTLMALAAWPIWLIAAFT